MRALNLASRALANLNGTALSVPNPQLLIDTFAITEAQASSEIENVNTTNDELFRYMAVGNERASDATKEAARYQPALATAIKRLQEDRRIDTRLLIDICGQILGSNVDVRDTAVLIGNLSARLVVYTIASPVEERRGVAAARELAPAAVIIVRTRYVRAIDDLMRLGANEVVVEEFEASLELFARALRSYEIPPRRIAHELNAVRDEHYGLLRGTAAPDLTLDALQHLGIHDALELVEVEVGSKAEGENARTLDLRRQTGAIQIAVVRGGVPIYRRDDTFQYRPGDTAVIVGDPEALERAAVLFRADPPATL